ncbi:MAG: sugar-binding protein [Prevotellaceae bacterium]|jgi:putative multiple sugar transport system substrate-binding protein|nr:sugar-binding protein [Prevotellaceae bacterium]
MKKVFLEAGILCVLVAGFLLTACHSDDEDSWKIGIALSDYNTIERWAIDGANMKTMLEHYGFTVDLQHVERDVNEQISQIESMITAGCKVIIVTAVDGTQLDAALTKAANAGIKVIAYDRLLMNTSAVDYYVTFNNTMVGTQQGQYIVDHLSDSATPQNMELFTGPADDNNVNFYFNGALAALNIGDNLDVPSGEMTMAACGIANWSTSVAKTRMARLINAQGYAPAGKKLDAVLCSNDALAEGVVAALTEAGYTAADFPIITGQDAEISAVKRIIAGTQSMTVFKDTRLSAEAAVNVVRAIKDGTEGSLSFGAPYNNDVKEVKTISCETTVVDKDNYRKVLIDSGYYTEVELQ